MRRKRQLVIGSKSSLLVIEFDPATGAVAQRANRRAEDLKAFVQHNDRLLVSAGGGAYLLDVALRDSEVVPVPAFEAAAMSGEVLCVAADGAVATFDEKYREWGRAPVVDGTKDAHDLLSVGTHLYVLDNIVSPVYVLLADVSDPRQVEVIAERAIESTYPHLECQFVDPAQRLWFVVSSYVNHGAYGQFLHTYSSYSGEDLGARAHLCSRWSLVEAATPSPRRYREQVVLADLHGREESALPGIRLHGTSAVLPCWTVVSEGDSLDTGSRYYLCRLTADRSTVKVDSFVPLGFDSDPGRIRIRAADGLVYVLAETVLRTEPRRESHLRLVVADQREDLTVVFDGRVVDPLKDRDAEFLDFVLWEETGGSSWASG